MIDKFWGFILTRLAKAQGFLDPRVVFSQLQKFSRPSEVWVPAELLRSGMVLQARGLINSQAIQHNLDWIWPFWVNRQFDPKDVAFIPRAFNITHINLSHRNWTAVGVPDCSDYVLVDPRGLVTPLFDGWSLDAWIIRNNEGTNLIPARLDHVYHQIRLDRNLQIITFSTLDGMSLRACVEVNIDSSIPTCKIIYEAQAPFSASLFICIRPYNPEGVSFINSIERLLKEEGWHINNQIDVTLKSEPWGYIFSNYQLGDILTQFSSSSLNEIPHEQMKVNCSVGMATSAAIYKLLPHRSQEVTVEIPLAKEPIKLTSTWSDHLQGSCVLRIPDKFLQSLYETALITLILHTPGDVYPGPYTYKRFWFRDASFILYAMLASNLTRNVEKILLSYPKRQTPLGYFKSQDGEWDSNGQALWIMERYCSMTGKSVPDELLKSIEMGVEWIKSKRVKTGKSSGHEGLLPAGFSAEHFGPSDFYYWDDFWSVSGLHAAALLLKEKNWELANSIENEAFDLRNAIETSLKGVEAHLEEDGIPASPYRRMDPGAIGSLIASYPLQFYAPDNKHIKATVEYLIKNHLYNGAYYHEMSHSGINVYLTLHIAQVLLRAGDPRFFDMVQKVAELATPTGQWPEAIHPQSKGGCMGDGQHVWAAAEWVMMLRNMFVREEEKEKTLILCSGIPHTWLEKDQHLFFGPTLTVFGDISVTIECKESIKISWKANWHNKAPRIEVHLPGFSVIPIENGITTVEINTQQQESHS